MTCNTSYLYFKFCQPASWSLTIQERKGIQCLPNDEPSVTHPLLKSDRQRDFFHYILCMLLAWLKLGKDLKDQPKAKKPR